VLTVAKLALADAERHHGAPDLPARFQRGMAAIDGAIKQVRALSLDLRPSLLDDLGLVPTLRWYLDRQGQEAGIESHFSVGPMRERFPSEIEIACFRVAQESITNVLRHARARRVWVDLREQRSRLQLLVRDDGCGFDPVAARERAARGTSMGLSSMEERVSLTRGGLSISSEAGGGTEIQAWFPLELPAT
jgi:signal transduction histidine kinase